MPRTKTPEEIAAWAKKMQELKAQKAAEREQETVKTDDFEVTDFKETPELDEIRAQMKEVMETNALLKAALLNKPSEGVNIGQGKVLGEVEKYLVDPGNYPDPTKRLADEPRLQPLAFKFNYELEYGVSVTSYETKAGINMKEPKFAITLNRIVVDSQGNPTNKRYIARKLIFHEDPQAAMVIARDNGIDIDRSDEKVFLNEMRYLRVRDWLFDIFWPKPIDEQAKISEEVIGGTIVQVFTKSSEESSAIDFDKLNTKVKI